ncbi:MAG: T9SS type A sorting domain-containing protein [Nonlabens sp.]|uniref:T9SS type A sorting domain-containing protein n=1 Tax=Nonlabens sp. TaxID=1888209 RepID=UPI003EF69780
MKKLLLIPFLFSLMIATAQSFDFPGPAGNEGLGWSKAQSSESFDATSAIITWTASQGSPKWRIISGAGIDASTNMVLEVVLKNNSSATTLRVKHANQSDGGSGNRFTNLPIEANSDFKTYYLDLTDAKWYDATATTPVTIQDAFEFIVRQSAPNTNMASAGSIEFDKISFIDAIPALQRTDYSFQVNADSEGFSGVSGSSAAVANGLLTWTFSNNTVPKLEQGIYGIDAASNRYMHIRLKNNSNDDELRVSFANTTGTPPPNRWYPSATISGMDTNYKTYTVDMTDGGSTTWTAEGVVTDLDLRVRSTTNSNQSTGGTIDIEYILFDNNAAAPDFSYTYSAGAWLPSDPQGNSTTSDNVTVDDNTSLTGDLDCNDLTITTGNELTAGSNTVNLAGDLINNGVLNAVGSVFNFAGTTVQDVTGNAFSVEDVLLNNSLGMTLNADVNLEGKLTLTNGQLTTQSASPGVLTFKSSNGKTAIVDEVVSGSIDGEVTIEQFYPANRAFRFVSSPVNMTGTLFTDWQQAGLNPGDAGYVANEGTQITGGTSGDGYDQSTTNNASLFGFNNAYTDINNSWTTFSAPTNTTSLNAGDAMRLFVRGDRSVSLTAAATATDTKLVTRGTIVTGPQPFAPTTVDGNFIFTGNPYQAQVDLNAVLTSSEDINTSVYYAWNPTMNNYVGYSFATGGVQSDVSQFIQPGQSFFVLVADDGDANPPSVNFTESAKSDATATTATYSLPQAFLTMTLENNLNVSKDRVTLLFNDNGDNTITGKDAPKFKGEDEQLMVLTSGAQLTIDDRSTPVNQEMIALQLENLVTGNYQFTVNASGFTIPAYIEDQFTGQFTQLDASNPTIIPFSVDTANAASNNVDRFRIRFSNTTLGLNDSAFAKAISLYPNPSNGNEVTLNNLSGDSIVSIVNLLGQTVMTQNVSSEQVRLDLSDLNKGTYIVTINSQENNQTLKLILN